MALIDAQGVKRDSFTRVVGDELVPAGDVILPLARLVAEARLTPRGRRLGVHLPNTAKPDEIAEYLGCLALISIEFPLFADGRGFSIARRFRQDHYRGRLRATGPLIADQMRHALGCGFDEIETPDIVLSRQPVKQWLAAASIITLRYQRDGGHGLSILDSRRAARQARQELRVAHAA
jgi:uncharacterized protein (DUF934 family)